MSFNILDLPDELQIRFLSFLPPLDLLYMTSVCQKWKRLALEGTLWTSIDTTEYYRLIPANQLIRLGIAGGKFLRKVNFRGCIQLTGHGLRILSEHCPNVHALVLKDCRGLSTHSIACFLQAATQIRTLDLSGLDTVRNSTLQHVGHHLLKLETLNIAWCRNISGSGVQAIAQGCKHLKSLRVDGCQQLDTSTMDALGKECHQLSRLGLNACTSLTDDALLSLLEHHPPLSHLDLSGCARLSDTTLRHLALQCFHLTHLQLASCVLFTDQGFCFMAPRLRTLVHLDLEDLQQITGTTVKTLANHQPSLARLCLSNCAQIADDAIIHLVAHGLCRHTLHHLELDNCVITDDTLDSIASFLRKDSKKAAPTLNIDVLDCANITEKGIRKALTKAGPRLSIKSFYSWKWEEQEDDGVAFTLNEQPRLSRRMGGMEGGIITDPMMAGHRTIRRTTRRHNTIATTAGQHQCIIL
ncbi:RNI-like protein [Lichtheimia hyalospora FSU 10163]|nr:RNI-like protein [Lichtheimia hyalospora FSU 10163]